MRSRRRSSRSPAKRFQLPYLPVLAYPPCGSPRDRRGAAAAARPSRRTSATTPRKIAAARRRRTPQFAGGDDPIPQAEAREFLPLAYFPIDPDYNVPRHARSRSTTRRSRDADLDRRQPQDAARRHARVHAQGPAAEADRVQRGRHRSRTRCSSPFSDLTSGTETYAAGRFLDLDAQHDRHLRARLQPRLHPLLLLQPDLRVPAIRRAENRLKIPIRAGERMKKSEAGSAK